MNGLPQDIDLAPLAAVTVTQLCFGEHQLQIHFANDSLIAIEGVCILLEYGQPEIRIEQFGSAATALCRMLGERIASAARTSDGGLTLTLANGTALSLLRESPEHESFQLVLRGATYVA